MKRTLIVANGELDAEAGRRIRAERWDGVVAVDGGAAHCERLGLRPSLIVGDLDSLPDGVRDAFKRQGVPFERHPTAKNETDLELGILRALEQGAESLVLAGVLGGRLDMTLGNLLLLADPRLVHVCTEIWHEGSTTRLLRPPGGDVSGQPGDTVSLIPLQGDAWGVVTEGLHYPLRNETLRFAQGRGISNVLVGEHGSVRLREGLLLLVHTAAGKEEGR